MSLFLRWPVMKALRNRIGRIISTDPIRRQLKMDILETERLVLRKLEQDDLRDIVAWENLPGAQSAEIQAKEFLAYCFREYRVWGFGPWGILLKETGTIVGNCAFPHIIFEERCGEVNYYVAPRHRGKGLAPEALNALLQFGFRDIGLTRIQARCEPDNLNSERVMQKAGMKFEGLIERAPFSKDPGPKQKLYAILREEFTLASNSASNSTFNAPASQESRS
jgi:[ribosomal protein S5]-alanine N-acetyltransferase